MTYSETLKARQKKLENNRDQYAPDVLLRLTTELNGDRAAHYLRRDYNQC